MAEYNEQEPPVVTASSLEGGYAFEKKEAPLTPVICENCQWGRKNDQIDPPTPNPETWCLPCLNNELVPGHPPEGLKR